MGALVTILCESCGYSEQEHFMRGAGMVGPKPEYDIAPCYTCQVVKQIDISTKNISCNNCKSTLEPFDEDADWHKCPKCYKMTLRILFGGMWD